MTDKHWCDIDCMTNDCEVLEDAHKEMRGEMMREGLPPGLIAFKRLEYSIILLQNINAQRYLRMKEMHEQGRG